MQISLITNRKGKNIWINYKVRIGQKNDNILEIEMRNMCEGSVIEENLENNEKKKNIWTTKIM
tara:strand:+ start:3383 stop:3571 length:189 start_codon:yes stop_codon:yes gene_type:complete